MRSCRKVLARRRKAPAIPPYIPQDSKGNDMTTAQHTVEKIGGTSMSNYEAVRDNIIIGKRKKSDLYQRIFVVSAKRLWRVAVCQRAAAPFCISHDLAPPFWSGTFGGHRLSSQTL